MRRLVVFAVIALLVAPSAFAWSGRGHVIVWMVAQEQLKKSGHLGDANALLSGAKLPPSCADAKPTDTCKKPAICRSGKDAPVSPDDWRSFEGARITAGWHFANINVDEKTYDRKRDCPSGACSVEQVDMMKALVADTKQQRPSRSEALAYLIHFVGDLHQPFHNAERIRDGQGDRGGNDVPVTFNGDTNLHSLWDSGLIGTHASLKKDSDYVEFLLTTVLADRDPKELAKGTPVSWANDAHAIAVEAYVEPNTAIDKDYVKKFVPKVDEQLLLAGLRLARFIEEALAGPE